MYKPDPRLPQDQQMLPTHAKRMMQEQWEREGKTGTAYDRDFNLLNDEQFQKPNSPRPERTSSLQPPPDTAAATSTNLDVPSRDAHPSSSLQPAEPWPLSRKTSDRQSDAGSASARPSTSGGYRITPTIPAPAPIERSPGSTHTASNGGSTNTNGGTVPHNPTPRVPDYDEKYPDEEPTKKGCCCIIM